MRFFKMLSIMWLLAAVGCVEKISTQGTAPSPLRTPVARSEESPRPAPDTAIERRVLYYPNDEIYGEIPEGVEEISLTTPDGLELNAWYLPPPETGPTLVYFHGNGGNLTGLGSQFEAFRSVGCGVLAIDYRGYGKSEGEPGEEGLYVDGLAAFDKAETLSPGRDLVVYGRSLGGGVASYVAKNRDCKGLVLESTFTSAGEVARYSHGDKGALLVNAFDNAAHLDGYAGPLLFIHGDRDETIPYFMSEQLHSALPGSELWRVEGAGHNDLRRVAGEEYSRRLGEFLGNL